MLQNIIDVTKKKKQLNELAVLHSDNVYVNRKNERFYTDKKKLTLKMNLF